MRNSWMLAALPAAVLLAACSNGNDFDPETDLHVPQDIFEEIAIERFNERHDAGGVNIIYDRYSQTFHYLLIADDHDKLVDTMAENNFYAVCPITSGSVDQSVLDEIISSAESSYGGRYVISERPKSEVNDWPLPRISAMDTHRFITYEMNPDFGQSVYILGMDDVRDRDLRELNEALSANVQRLSENGYVYRTDCGYEDPADQPLITVR